MTVEIIFHDQSPQKYGIELATPGSAVRHASVARHFTDCATRPGKSQEVSPFPSGDHKAAMNRHESMRNTRHENTNDPQKKYRLRTVSKNILLEGLN